jgi:ketosteroid isomerase-like protein
MSEHPNVRTVNRMTEAAVTQNRAVLADVFSPDLKFHLRGPYPKAGDHDGVDGFLEVIGSMFELTNGDIDLEQKFCVAADDDWVAEWEHASFGRNNHRLESDNCFVYRFDHGRITEMWMYLGAAPDRAEAFLA